jgi:copper chaperone CopZ
METTLKVTGMNCGACVNHVTKTLQSVAGVTLAAVDLSSGAARVQHDENADPAALVAAIEEAGYGARQV